MKLLFMQTGSLPEYPCLFILSDCGFSLTYHGSLLQQRSVSDKTAFRANWLVIKVSCLYVLSDCGVTLSDIVRV